MCATLVSNQRRQDSHLNVLRAIRRNQTTKDADLVIKMSRDFIKDMRQKMFIIHRVQRTYQASSEFVIGTVFSDIMKRFKHMCDLYNGFATIKRYILGYQLNQTMQPNPDVVVIYQFMLSDYNEILMMIELFKRQQLGWREGEDTMRSRQLISKQMAKFGNLKEEDLPKIKAKPDDKAKTDKTAKTEKPKARRWEMRENLHPPRKWSGELDGVGFDNR